MTKLTENQHRKFLDMMLVYAKDLKSVGQEITPERKERIADNVKIARDVGYETLADEYVTKFREQGIDL